MSGERAGLLPRRRVTVFVDRNHDSILCTTCGDLFNAGRSSDTEYARRHTRRTGHRTCVSVTESRFYDAEPVR